MFLLFTTAFSATTTLPATLECETSERWRQFDESVIDYTAPAGTVGVPVTIGCRFGGVPGAVVDVGSWSMLQGMKVLGIRRGSGQVILAANPLQAVLLNTQSTPIDTHLVRDGDWRRLIEAIGRVPHRAEG